MLLWRCPLWTVPSVQNVPLNWRFFYRGSLCSANFVELFTVLTGLHFRQPSHVATVWVKSRTRRKKITSIHCHVCQNLASTRTDSSAEPQKFPRNRLVQQKCIHLQKIIRGYPTPTVYNSLRIGSWPSGRSSLLHSLYVWAFTVLSCYPKGVQCVAPGERKMSNQR